MNFFQYAAKLIPILAVGAQNTLMLFGLTLLFALPLGLIITFASISRFPPLKWISSFYIWILRGTPLMLQLFFMFYCIPIWSKQQIVWDAMTTAVITFSLNYAAYFAEIYRGGILSIDKGQHEAAKTLGFTKWQTMSRIIIPQTVRRVLPAITNEAITLIKDTALIGVIGATEILKLTKDTVNRTSNPMAYAVAAIFYLVLTYFATYVSNRLEKNYVRYEAKSE